MRIRDLRKLVAQMQQSGGGGGWRTRRMEAAEIAYDRATGQELMSVVEFTKIATGPLFIHFEAEVWGAAQFTFRTTDDVGLMENWIPLGATGSGFGGQATQNYDSAQPVEERQYFRIGPDTVEEYAEGSRNTLRKPIFVMDQADGVERTYQVAVQHPVPNFGFDPETMPSIVRDAVLYVQEVGS
jgi:hypothetical protein